MNRFSLAAIAFVAALSFVPASAGDASVTVTGSAPARSGVYQLKAVNVVYSDLDVTKAEGAAALLDRIEHASRVVCGERAGFTMDSMRTKIFDTCRARATHYAAMTVDAPQLTQLAASH